MTNGNSAERERLPMTVKEIGAALSEDSFTRSIAEDRVRNPAWFQAVEIGVRIAEKRMAALSVCADGGKGEAVDFVFPPMPPAVVMHAKVGPLFDRLSMHFYASKCMSIATPQAECAPRADAEKDAALTDREIIALADQFMNWGKVNYVNSDIPHMLRFARAILAANKEPQP